MTIGNVDILLAFIVVGMLAVIFSLLFSMASRLNVLENDSWRTRAIVEHLADNLYSKNNPVGKLEKSNGIVCPFCRSSAEDNSCVFVFCDKCKTKQHAACWETNGGCSTFGCDSGRCHLVEISSIH